MGITISRELEGFLSNARVEAKDPSRIDAVLLRNPKFVNCLSKAWNEIPPKSRTSILKRLDGDSKSKKHRMWNTKTLSGSRITINPTIKPLLESWENDPSTFLTSSPADAHGISDYPVWLYWTLKGFDQSEIVNPIRRRFFLLALAQAKSRLAKHLLRSGNKADFVDIVSRANPCNESHDDIKQNCITWANIGGRYDTITKELGGKGSLILLPEDIPKSIWEHEMPMKGPDHQLMIEKLKARSVCAEAETTNAHRVANKIWDRMRSISDNWVNQSCTSIIATALGSRVVESASASIGQQNAVPDGMRTLIDALVTQQEPTEGCVNISCAPDSSQTAHQQQTFNEQQEYSGGIVSAGFEHTDQASRQMSYSALSNNPSTTSAFMPVHGFTRHSEVVDTSYNAYAQTTSGLANTLPNLVPDVMENNFGEIWSRSFVIPAESPNSMSNHWTSSVLIPDPTTTGPWISSLLISE